MPHTRYFGLLNLQDSKWIEHIRIVEKNRRKHFVQRNLFFRTGMAVYKIASFFNLKILIVKNKNLEMNVPHDIVQ